MQSVFELIKALPAIYLAFPAWSMWQDMGWPCSYDVSIQSHIALSEETLDREYCPTRCVSILHPEAWLVLAASTSCHPISSPQGIEGTCAASHLQSTAQTDVLLA